MSLTFMSDVKFMLFGFFSNLWDLNLVLNSNLFQLKLVLISNRKFSLLDILNQIKLKIKPFVRLFLRISEQLLKLLITQLFFHAISLSFNLLVKQQIRSCLSHLLFQFINNILLLYSAFYYPIDWILSDVLVFASFKGLSIYCDDAAKFVPILLQVKRSRNILHASMIDCHIIINSVDFDNKQPWTVDKHPLYLYYTCSLCLALWTNHFHFILFHIVIKSILHGIFGF